MTKIMTKKDLNQYRNIVAELEQIERQRRELKENMESLSASTWIHTHAAGSAFVHDSMAERIARSMEKAEELKRLYNQKLSELIIRQTDIEQAILSLANPAKRLLMRYRYFEGMSWDVIAEKMHYSSRQILRIHECCLQELLSSKGCQTMSP